MYSIPSPPHSIIEYNTHYTISNTNTNTCGLKGTDNRTSGLCDVLWTITTANNNNNPLQHIKQVAKDQILPHI